MLPTLCFLLLYADGKRFILQLATAVPVATDLPQLPTLTTPETFLAAQTSQHFIQKQLRLSVKLPLSREALQQQRQLTLHQPQLLQPSRTLARNCQQQMTRKTLVVM
jgi:hypothetical protein